MKVTGAGYQTITNISIGVITTLPRNFIIRGTDGVGKSMMMRHLFFEAVENYNDYRFLPILAPLKNFTKADTNIEKFLFKAIHEFDSNIEFALFKSELINGGCLILLDGLDEIPSNARDIFEKSISSFMKTYENNRIVMSSRPATNQFLQFEHFPVMEIMPFNKEKALKLIDKLEYHSPEVKAKFREDLDNKLYSSHQQFASNPLLLTIMLMTYTSYGEVPAKRHMFYSKAYETMSRLHDASKGAYVRPMHTGLTPEQFSVYFSEFCARTYREEVLEFTEQLFTQYMTRVIKHQRKPLSATTRDFLLDLTENLCIMYKEGERYFFIHRSFQEYFTAKFFESQMDDTLWKTGQFFENQKHRQLGDMAFDMLYDMIPDRIDRYIFLPLLNNLWEKCDKDGGYWAFLKEMYPVIHSYSGNPGDYTDNAPQSYLYGFASRLKCTIKNRELFNVNWPSAIASCDETEWTSIVTGTYIGTDGKHYCSTESVAMDEVDVDDDYIEEYGEPEVEGVTWEIDIQNLLNDPEQFSPMIEFMQNESFPLMSEYLKMRMYTSELNEKINNKPSSGDWFDEF